MPMDDPPDWSRREAQMAGAQKAKREPDTDDLPLLEPRLFRSRDGRVWLEHMTKLLDQPMGPSPSESLLRYMEAQRDIVRRIKRHIAQAEAKESSSEK